MKAYVTKHALTEGIREVDNAETFASGTAIQYTYGKGSFPCFAHGKDWHKTREEAVAQARVMQERKLASLRKQISRIEKLRFNI